MLYFKAYGLIFRSTLVLTGYEKINPDNMAVDIDILQGKVSVTGLDSPLEQGLFFQIKQDEIWFNVPSIARFLVQAGKRIIYERADKIEDEVLQIFLSGPCLAAVLMQRDLFVLNGSVFKIKEAAAVYIGDNCSGKTSLLASMLQQGYFLLSDGLCVINHGGLVFPGPNQIEIWEDTAKNLNIANQTLQSIRKGFKKYRLSVPESYYPLPLPLKAIYALKPCKTDVFNIKNLTGSEKINVLQKNIYNKTYVAGLRKQHLYFNYCAKLAQKLNIVLIEFNRVDFNMRKINQSLFA